MESESEIIRNIKRELNEVEKKVTTENPEKIQSFNSGLITGETVTVSQGVNIKKKIDASLYMKSGKDLPDSSESTEKIVKKLEERQESTPLLSGKTVEVKQINVEKHISATVAIDSKEKEKQRTQYDSEKGIAGTSKSRTINKANARRSLINSQEAEIGQINVKNYYGGETHLHFEKSSLDEASRDIQHQDKYSNFMGVNNQFLPPRNPYLLIGREDCLKEMNEFFLPHKKPDRKGKVMVLCGIPGIGKTALARHFINDLKENKLCFWLDASSFVQQNSKKAINPLREQYAILGHRLQELGQLTLVKDIEIIARQVKNWLEKNNNWFMVIDDAISYEEIKTLIPTPGGDILITSTSLYWPAFKTKKIAKLDEMQTFQLISNRIGNTVGHESVKKMYDELSGYPLVLAYACAYIANYPDLSLDKFLELYKKYPKDTLDEQLLEGEYPNSIVQVLALILDSILKDKKYGEPVIIVLLACSLIYYKDIPCSFIEEVLKHTLEERWEVIYLGVRKLLEKFLLIEYDRNRNSLSLNPTFHKLVRHYHLKGEENLETIKNQVIRILLVEISMYYTNMATGHINYHHLAQLTKHIEHMTFRELTNTKDALDKQIFSVILGGCYLSLHQGKELEYLVKEHIHLNTITFLIRGIQPISIDENVHKLIIRAAAYIYGSWGFMSNLFQAKPAEALTIIDALLKVVDVLDDGDFVKTIIYFNKASGLQITGKITESLEFYEKALPMCHEKIPAAVIKSNLAFGYLYLNGNVKHSIELLESCMPILADVRYDPVQYIFVQNMLLLLANLYLITWRLSDWQHLISRCKQDIIAATQEQTDNFPNTLTENPLFSSFYKLLKESARDCLKLFELYSSRLTFEFLTSHIHFCYRFLSQIPLEDNDVLKQFIHAVYFCDPSNLFQNNVCHFLSKIFNSKNNQFEEELKVILFLILSEYNVYESKSDIALNYANSAGKIAKRIFGKKSIFYLHSEIIKAEVNFNLLNYAVAQAILDKLLPTLQENYSNHRLHGKAHYFQGLLLTFKGDFGLRSLKFAFGLLERGYGRKSYLFMKINQQLARAYFLQGNLNEARQKLLMWKKIKREQTIEERGLVGVTSNWLETLISNVLGITEENIMVSQTLLKEDNRHIILDNTIIECFGDSTKAMAVFQNLDRYLFFSSTQINDLRDSSDNNKMNSNSKSYDDPQMRSNKDDKEKPVSTIGYQHYGSFGISDTSKIRVASDSKAQTQFTTNEKSEILIDLPPLEDINEETLRDPLDNDSSYESNCIIA